MTINGDALRKKAQELDIIGQIYNNVERNMKWDTMNCTGETDENGEAIYTMPEEENGDGYYMTQYERYMVYQKVLKAIAKLAQ